MSVLKIKNDNNQWIHLPSIKGEQGQDGFSPTATVVKNGNAAVITITDKNGTTTATVLDGVAGSQGPQGIQGQNGEDGFSPTAIVTKEDNVTTISITDKNGTTEASILDGIADSSGIYVGNEVPQDPNVNIWIDEEENDDYDDLIKDVVETIQKTSKKDIKANVIYKEVKDQFEFTQFKTFEDGANDMPFDKITCYIRSSFQQLGDEDPSPQNVRPIVGGQTKITIVQTGDNLFNKETVTAGKVLNISDGTLEEDEYWATSDFFVVHNNLYISWIGNVNRYYRAKVAFYTRDKIFISAQERLNLSQRQVDEVYFNVPSEAFYARVSFTDTQYFYIRFGLNQKDEEVIVDDLINYKQPRIIDVIWDQQIGEVIQGDLQLLSGKFKVYTKKIIFNNEKFFNVTREENQNGVFFICEFDYQKLGIDRPWLEQYYYNLLMCNKYSLEDIQIIPLESNNQKVCLLIKDDNCADITTFKNTIDEVPIQIILQNYSTGIDYQLPAINDIKTFYRKNRIYTLGAFNDISYPADTKMYIDKKVNNFLEVNEDTSAEGYISVKENCIIKYQIPLRSLYINNIDCNLCYIIFRTNSEEEKFHITFRQIGQPIYCNIDPQNLINNTTYKIEIINGKFFTITELPIGLFPTD